MLSVTVMHVLLFVLHVCMLSECEGERVRCGCGEFRTCVWYTWFRYCV